MISQRLHAINRIEGGFQRNLHLLATRTNVSHLFPPIPWILDQLFTVQPFDTTDQAQMKTKKKKERKRRRRRKKKRKRQNPCSSRGEIVDWVRRHGGCVKNGARTVPKGGKWGARANARSLMRASYHNLISVDIWGEPMGRRGPCKGRNTGGRPWIFTILIIVSAWDPDATRQLAISPSNPPSIRQFSFRMTDHVSDGHRGRPTRLFPLIGGEGWGGREDEFVPRSFGPWGVSNTRYSRRYFDDQVISILGIIIFFTIGRDFLDCREIFRISQVDKVGWCIDGTKW